MKSIAAVVLLAGIVLFSSCGQDKNLKLAEQMVKDGNLKKAIELYTNVVTDQQDTKAADNARLALAGIYYKQKNYENAIKNLSGMSDKRKEAQDVTDILAKCQAERLLLEGIKSAAVEFRQHYVKEREVKHQEINYSSPVFSGTADSLFTASGVKMPKIMPDISNYKVDVTLTDDPLEPTKININFPDGFKKELVLNY